MLTFTLPQHVAGLAIALVVGFVIGGRVAWSIFQRNARPLVQRMYDEHMRAKKLALIDEVRRKEAARRPTP